MEVAASFLWGAAHFVKSLQENNVIPNFLETGDASDRGVLCDVFQI